MNWKTFGHNHIKVILEKQLASRRIPHAYLFMGPASLGKHTLAVELAGKILQTENPEKHPDFMTLNEEGEIPVEKVRELIASVSLGPIAGTKKVVIINNAEQLNKSGANALLKTLEEPGESTVLILVASERPLLTILSRCQKFNFNPFSQKQTEDFLAFLGVTLDREVQGLGFGLPGRLKKLAFDPEFLSGEKENLAALDRLQKLGEGERILEIGKLAELETLDLQKLLLSWVMKLFFHAKQHSKNTVPLQSAVEALKNLSLNQNKKLILQNLLLKL